MRARGRRRSTPSDPADAEAAYQAVVTRLARQPQSAAFLAQRLLRLGYEQGAVTVAVDRAKRQGYLNDESYAQAVVRRRSRTRGKALIAQELRARGVAEATIGAALGDISPETESKRALAVARSALQRRPTKDPKLLFARVGSALSRRGFSSGLIHRICDELSLEFRATGGLE